MDWSPRVLLVLILVCFLSFIYWNHRSSRLETANPYLAKPLVEASTASIPQIREGSVSIPSVKIVEKNVEDLNQKQKKYEDQLRSEGWKNVQSDPPNDEIKPLQELSESKVRTILLSSYLTKTQISDVYIVYNKTNDEDLKGIIVESLGRAKVGEAQEVLLKIYPLVTDESLKREIVSWLNPGLSQRSELFLKETLEDPRQAHGLRIQAGTQLILYQRTHNEPLEKIMRGIPSDLRSDLSEFLRRL